MDSPIAGHALAEEAVLASEPAMADIAYDVLLESGIRVRPLPIWEEERVHPEAYSNPRLLQNIAREGVAW